MLDARPAVSVSDHTLEAVRASTLALLQPGAEFAVWTDSVSCADIVLLGYATPRVSAVIAIDRLEYDGLRLADLLGFATEAPPVAESRLDAFSMKKPPASTKLIKGAKDTRAAPRCKPITQAAGVG
jgi:hypothetical protein